MKFECDNKRCEWWDKHTECAKSFIDYAACNYTKALEREQALKDRVAELEKKLKMPSFTSGGNSIKLHEDLTYAGATKENIVICPACSEEITSLENCMDPFDCFNKPKVESENLVGYQPMKINDATPQPPKDE